MRLRIGIVGLGNAGHYHGRALRHLDREGACRWVGVCGRDHAKLDTYRRELEVPDHTRSYIGLDAMLDAGTCDAVVLATPDPIHTEQLLRCSARGVHVLVEKPLATSVDAGREALMLARRRDVVVRVGYHLRYHPAHVAVRERYPALIGRLRAISMRWAWPDPKTSGWRARGEGRFWAVSALGTHCIDLGRWFSGEEPSRVTCLTTPPLAVDQVDQAAELSIDCGGVLVHASVAITHSAQPQLILSGESGEIECVGTLGTRDDGEVWVRPVGALARELEFTRVDPFRAQLLDFFTAIHARDHRDARELLGNLMVLDAIAEDGAELAIDLSADPALE
ncbi:Gfo/Idh/MocA family oxidoreductase [Pseudenhygromyxa sp. WMMC2535]|uniref:Gfo/Idh/MocA family protein n=1 Tax=Pseudenhygromyxa sp. WMMC2535 TaxID=2712867 RepID=UPI00155725FE|nr:Gfo/Idh/MocA family oxidoreductase [Pseudenhygromyxa sp. WMMC2535]NVB42397.1 Gfo/Idh/MocA family oxidoreductase [Pseudenhygromyxa sp. WMMC2535]